MSITTGTRTKSSVIVPSPLLAEPDGGEEPRPGETLAAVIARLANLRERYLLEMQAARKRVKKNFLIK